MKYIGGTYGGFNKPTPFLCVFLKLLQIGPDKEVPEASSTRRADSETLSELAIIKMQFSRADIKLNAVFI